MLVCAKCIKTVDGGRETLKALKAGLIERANANGRRPGKLVKTRCLGVCPKRAVTLASGASLARGELLILGSAADAPAALDTLLR